MIQKRDHEHQKHSSRANGHQRLEDEPRVEVDAIEGSNTSGRGISEELAMQKHHPTDEVKTGNMGKDKVTSIGTLRDSTMPF
ncbi:hypothetical protein CEXT_680201 [Caerostris extrusa]|uniref:Uncharacterized protein n=1 Tax=Caerostris extrusa TaxID=172846 RepID=A0AAV4MTX8_CAEEX|nr:hypothetical protein CEXT_680201 [Caerostris extrusa]